MRCLLLGTCSGLTSFLTKKSGRRFVFCFGAWLRAGSLSGTYAGPASVPLPFRASFFWRGVANNRQVCSLLQPFEERLCGLKQLACETVSRELLRQNEVPPALHHGGCFVLCANFAVSRTRHRLPNGSWPQQSLPAKVKIHSRFSSLKKTKNPGPRLQKPGP